MNNNYERCILCVQTCKECDLLFSAACWRQVKEIHDKARATTKALREALQKVEEKQYVIEAYEESLLESEAYAIAIEEAFQESPRPF